jgi:hypothetical protein
MLGSMEDDQTFSTFSFMNFGIASMNTWILLWECIFKLFTVWILSHMTHVLKIGRRRSLGEHWIRFLYWGLGGVCCFNPIISGPFWMMISNNG